MMLKYAIVIMQKANFDLNSYRAPVINWISLFSGTQRRQSCAMNVTISLLFYLPTVWMELFHMYGAITAA